MRVFSFISWATAFLVGSGVAMGDGDSRIKRGTLIVGEHAEVRGFESFELVYQDDGLYASQDGSVEHRDGAEGATYKGSDSLSVIFNHDVDVSITSDQPYYYLADLLDPGSASDKERITDVTDRLAYDDVDTTTLAYSSALDAGVDSADSKDFILSSEVRLGDVDDQKAGVYQKVYTVTVASAAF